MLHKNPENLNRFKIMHDIKYIRENPEVFDKALSLRGISKMSAKILSLDEERRCAILAAETATAEQNKAAKEIGRQNHQMMKPPSIHFEIWLQVKRKRLPH